MKYILSALAIITLSCTMLFVVPVHMQTTKDYNHAGKTFTAVVESTQSKVISVVESYIPSSSRREHLNYIPPDVRDKNGRLATFRMIGDTLAPDAEGIYADIQDIAGEIQSLYGDIENFHLDVTHFYGGSMGGDVPEITVKISFTVKSIVNGNKTNYEQTIPLKVNMSEF